MSRDELSDIQKELRATFEAGLNRVLDDIQSSTSTRVDQALSRYEQELASTVSAAKTKILDEAESFSAEAKSRVTSTERAASDRIQQAADGFEATLSRLQEVLSNYTKQLDEAAQRQVGQVLDEFKQQLSQTLGDINQATRQEFNAFVTSAQNQTLNLEKHAQEQFQKEASRYTDSLQSAKKEITAKYAASLKQNLPSIVGSALHRILTPKQQEELVTEALVELQQNSWKR